MIKYIGENLIKWRDKMKVAILGAGYIGGIMCLVYNRIPRSCNIKFQ